MQNKSKLSEWVKIRLIIFYPCFFKSAVQAPTEPGFVKMQRLILLKLWFKMLTIYLERQIYIYNHNAEEIKIKSPKIYKQKKVLAVEGNVKDMKFLRHLL